MKRFFLYVMAVLMLLLASCQKYDISHVDGVAVDGEYLLPVAKASCSVYDLMKRFEIDSLINLDAEGNMSYGLNYGWDDVVNASELLRFKDFNLEYELSLDTIFPFVFQHQIDTTIIWTQDVELESEHLKVLEAELKSGVFDFGFETNIALLQGVVIRSSAIKDADGNEFELTYLPEQGLVSYDLQGMHYESDEFNKLQFTFAISFSTQEMVVPNYYVKVNLLGRNIAIREMRGCVESFQSHTSIDTIFDLFPFNLSGSLLVNGAHLIVNERNTFGLSARMQVDTALVWGPGVEPYSLFSPMPLVVDAPCSPYYVEAFNQYLTGSLTTSATQTYSAATFIVNPEGIEEVVSLNDTCSIDVLLNVEVPFAFNVDYIHYMDTVNMRLSDVENPEIVEKLTLSIDFTNTIPLNLAGRFYFYDSTTERIVDTLLSDGQLIRASFDGSPSSTCVSVEIDGPRLDRIMTSDRIIMVFDLDTDSHDVELKAHQSLDAIVRAKLKLNGVLDF